MFQLRNDTARKRNRQDPEEKKAFARRFGTSLDRLGVTDAEFARLCGITKSAVFRYRTADSFPDAQFLFVVADALNVSARWLAIGEGSPQRDPIVDGLLPEQLQLLAWYEETPYKDRASFRVMASGLANQPWPDRPKPLATVHEERLPYRAQEPGE